MKRKNRTTHIHPAKWAYRSAFTLVELLISIAVITVLAGMAAQTFRTVLDSRAVAISQLEINETARTALNFMSNEIRTAYLTPDSVKPYTGQAQDPNAPPRFRFAGIYRDAATSRSPNPGTTPWRYDDLPGAGEDLDGDGRVDEEILDGLDTDRDGLVDEDIGMIPSDMLHFVSAIENSGQVQLQEISYGLDPTGTRLVRRTRNLNLTGGQQLTNIRNFGQFIDTTSNRRLVPPPIPIGSRISASLVNNAIETWDLGSRHGQVSTTGTVLPGNAPGRTFQVLAYDIRGLRFRYWYYDYNRGGWRWTREWDSARETALMTPSDTIFAQPAANNSIEGGTIRSFANIIVNEPEDIYPRAGVGPGQFLVTNPQQLFTPDYRETLERISRRTDGLPNMVEIILYAQDRDGALKPRPYTTRVFIPNNYRSSVGL